MQKMHSILPSTIYQLYITVFPLFFLVTFFPRKKRLFSTWESFSKTQYCTLAKAKLYARKLKSLLDWVLKICLRIWRHFSKEMAALDTKNSIFWAILFHSIWFFHCHVNITLSEHWLLDFSWKHESTKYNSQTNLKLSSIFQISTF